MSRKINQPLSQNPIPKPPKPSPKGKTPRAKKPKADLEDKDFIDVFRTILDADAGGDTSPQEQFSWYLSLLSRAELERMDKRIQRVCEKLLQKADGSLRIQETYGLFRQTMDDHLQSSLNEQIALNEKIGEKLQQMGVSKAQFSSKGKVLRVFVGNQWYSMNKFLKYFFQKELDEAQEMVDEGKLIRKNARHTGRYFITKAIEESLPTSNEHESKS